MEKKENWFVIYTRSRHERILAEQLEGAGYEIYLPLVKKKSVWSDRNKVLEVPLFKSYVFIKGECEKMHMKDYKSFVGFVQYNGKPAVVRQDEIDIIKNVIKHGYDISEASSSTEFSPGCKVSVIGGPLRGMTGELTSSADSQRFLIRFENLGNILMVKVPARSLKKIEVQ